MSNNMINTLLLHPPSDSLGLDTGSISRNCWEFGLHHCLNISSCTLHLFLYTYIYLYICIINYCKPIKRKQHC